MSEAERREEQADRLAEDFLARARRGETPSVEEYAQAHPELAAEIRHLFPLLDLVEDAAAATDLGAGTPRFEGLEILAEIAPGVGGMGQVFKARETSLDRVVAVKTVVHHLRTAEGRAWFEREARAAAALDHPNIVKIFSFEPDLEPPYYVMQFVDGQPLDEACRGRGYGFVARVTEKIARALAFAHRRGVVHRDIKPANILVDREGEPHVTDFGLARNLGSLTGSGPPHATTFKGTPLFIAPEVYDDPGRSGSAADLYALGVTLYVLLCGRTPFAGRDLGEVRADVQRAKPRLPQEIDSDVPEPLQRICLKAMEADPDDRYESAEAMADDLRRFLGDREVLARPRRYQVELHGRLRTHLSDVRLWHEQKLIDTPDMDRLLRPYHWLLSEDSPWRELSRRFPWETFFLRLGGWLVLLGSVLWPAFYWDQLGRAERVASIALPTLLLNFAGWLSHRRGIRFNAIIFLTGGALLLPVLMAVVLSEYDLLAFPQSAEREAFGEMVEGPAEPGAQGFVATNFQLTLSAFALVAYASVLVLQVRARVFALLIGAGAYVLHFWIMMLAGFREWADRDQLTRAVVLFLPLAFGFVVLARRLEKLAHGAWSPSFYAFYPAPFVGLMTALAYTGGTELILDRGGADFDVEAVQVWLMANGPIYLLGALVSARSPRGYVRFWGPMFMALFPLSFLVPCNVLFEHGPALFRAVGTADVRLYELLGGLLGVAFIALGTRLQRPAVTLSGIAGTAVFILRATELHFRDTMSWPLVLALSGAVAMAVGVAVTFVRARRLAGRE